MELGKKIASLRKRNKITQAQLAEYLAVLPQAVSRWEADGGMPDVMLLPKIATFFGVSMDELFGMNDMEQIENLVCKYSVLRDEKSFEEVVERIDNAVENLEAQIQYAEEGCNEWIRQRQQLLAWKVHIFIQKSRKCIEDAKLQLDELLKEVMEEKNTLYWPLRLQKQQLRMQMGEAKKVIQESKEFWEQEQNLDSLYCYMMALLEVQDGKAILNLWEQDVVQSLTGFVTEQTELLWLVIFSAARIEREAAVFEQYFHQFEKDATSQAVFDAEWELFRLYEELGMQEEKRRCGAQLLEKMKQLDFNEYIRDVYTKKIEEL